MNVVADATTRNPVRAGYSINISDILTVCPPTRPTTTSTPMTLIPSSTGAAPDIIYGGEVGDADYYDAAGALLFPVERMRRWVTPADINGTGSVYAVRTLGSRRREQSGSDAFGRVEFTSYFRPPGRRG